MKNSCSLVTTHYFPSEKKKENSYFKVFFPLAFLMQYGIYVPSLWSSKAVGGDRMLVMKWPKCSCKGTN